MSRHIKEFLPEIRSNMVKKLKEMEKDYEAVKNLNLSDPLWKTETMISSVKANSLLILIVLASLKVFLPLEPIKFNLIMIHRFLLFFFIYLKHV